MNAGIIVFMPMIELLMSPELGIVCMSMTLELVFVHAMHYKEIYPH